jgi:hypothetical protein
MGNEKKTFEERFNEEAVQVEANLAEGKAAIDNAEPVGQVKEVESPRVVETAEAVETPVEETPVAQEKTWAEIKEEHDREEADRLELEEIKRLKEDTFIQEYRKAKAQGIDIKAFVNSMADVDVSMISEETLFKNSLSGKNLSETEIEDEWYEFKNQKDFIKDAYLEKERNKITSQVEEKRKAIKGNSVIPNVNEVYGEAKSGLDNFLDKAVNTKVNGIVVTPKMALDLAKLAPKFFASSMKDGKVDVSDALETAFAKLAATQWRENLIEQGKTQGLEIAFAAKHNPNATSMVSSQKAKEMTKEQKEEEAWKSRFARASSSLLTDK